MKNYNVNLEKCLSSKWLNKSPVYIVIYWCSTAPMPPKPTDTPPYPHQKDQLNHPRLQCHLNTASGMFTSGDQEGWLNHRGQNYSLLKVWDLRLMSFGLTMLFLDIGYISQVVKKPERIWMYCWEPLNLQIFHLR